MLTELVESALRDLDDAPSTSAALLEAGNNAFPEIAL
jgi:hypothetical protein